MARRPIAARIDWNGGMLPPRTLTGGHFGEEESRNDDDPGVG
jgi:hypothetical protein